MNPDPSDQRSPADPLPDEVLWSWVDRDAPELDSHLDAHPEDADRVARFRQQMEGVSRMSGAGRQPEWIGPYRVTGFLGAGAMGLVYAARQQRPDRDVAIKVLRTWGLGDPRQLARFEREAAALGRLHHPAIATIHEAGVTEDGIPFLVMERVNGVGLLEHASNNSLTPTQRIELFCKVCEGVEAAHAGGVVHRDLKPSNILVDMGGQPRVVDFGLARLMDRTSGSLGVCHTGTGMAGTLPYMSPEQLDHTRGAVDAQSDVYALGVILFELLLGRLPHALAGLPLTSVVRAVCDDPPPRPRQLDGTMDPQLEAVILKAMGGDRSHRYGSAAALAQDLTRFLRGDPVNARAPGVVLRLRSWARPRRHWLGGLLAATLVAVAIAGWIRGGSDPQPEVPRLAQFVGGAPAELAPFGAMRWRRDAIDVRHDGRWWELAVLAGQPVDALVGAAKSLHPAAYREVLREDLVGVLSGIAGSVPVDGVTMYLEPLGWEGGGVVVKAAMTREHWLALQQQGEWVMAVPDSGELGTLRDRVAPFEGMRYTDDGIHVCVEGVWYGLVHVAGIEPDAIRARAVARGAVRGEPDWQKRFAEDLPFVLRSLDVSLRDVVLVGLRDLDTGEVLAERGLTMTEEKRRLLKDQLGEEEGK